MGAVIGRVRSARRDREHPSYLAFGTVTGGAVVSMATLAFLVQTSTVPRHLVIISCSFLGGKCCADQYTLLISFTAGAPKIARA